MNKVFLFALLLALPCVTWGQRKGFDRGYPEPSQNIVVAPKGSWMFGGNAGVSSSAQQNYDFLLVSGINAKAHNFVVSPAFCYMVADNLGIGVRGKYTRGYIAVESAKAGFDAADFKVSNYSHLRHKYLGAVFCRLYRPIGRSGRISAFVDGELALGGSQIKAQTAHTESVRGSFGSTFHLNIGVNTGMLVFLTSHLALDARLGLLEFSYGVSNQVHNQVDNGRAFLGSANFMADLLSLSIGLAYYL